MKLEELQHIYFVGIGGIGMSALARYFNHLGATVSGYDRVETDLTQKLVEEGMSIHYEDDIQQLPTTIDLVVYTPAIPDDHQELNHLKAAGYTVMKRAAVLGLISKNRKTIAVAGTHGKTTTSAILTHILKEGGIDCTAFLGGIAENFGSNFVAGESDWVVMEADEFDRSFLHLEPTIAIITSMDADHLDIYKNKEEFEQTFLEFAGQVKKSIYCQANLPIDSQYNLRVEWNTYGMDRGVLQAVNIRPIGLNFGFGYLNTLQRNPRPVELQFTLPGSHNVMNAVAAIGVAKKLGCSDKTIKNALLSFQGIKRRFELLEAKERGVVYIDDYAHHPTELIAAIGAVRMLCGNRKVTGVFQPHLYSRTQDFSEEFAIALDQLDEAIILDIYPARELPIEGVTSRLILDKMKLKHKELASKKDLIKVLRTKQLDVLITLGAGDIGVLVDEVHQLVKELNYVEPVEEETDTAKDDSEQEF
jgi:UDP-N-acetylmuramate--alanine ligase